MGPEQLQTLIENGFRQQNSLSLVYLVAVPILSFIGMYLASYWTEKAKNAATKDDIAKITNEVEATRHRFNESLEQFKTSLSANLEFVTVRYAEELKIYKELWSSICDLRDSVRNLRPILDLFIPSPTVEARMPERLKAYEEALSKFRSFARRNKPFYSPEIAERVTELAKRTSDEAEQCENYQKTGFVQQMMENHKKIQAEIDLIEASIRTRLLKFDAVRPSE